jgi:hypothetical protein
VHRRKFLESSAGAACAFVASDASATVLYNDQTVKLDQIRPDPKDLWVRASDVPRVNGFTLKPQGACRGGLCLPVSKQLRSGPWFNLTGFAQRLHQVSLHEDRVWSFGEIPVVRGDFYTSRVAPDFSVPDRKGRMVHLSDFRGKKVLVITWASW